MCWPNFSKTWIQSSSLHLFKYHSCDFGQKCWLHLSFWKREGRDCAMPARLWKQTVFTFQNNHEVYAWVSPPHNSLWFFSPWHLLGDLPSAAFFAVFCPLLIAAVIVLSIWVTFLSLWDNCFYVLSDDCREFRRENRREQLPLIISCVCSYRWLQQE